MKRLIYCAAMLPEAVQETLRETFKPDEMVREIVPVYEKYLSVEDLRGILAFYRSPVGLKLLQVQPQLTKRVQRPEGRSE